MSWRKEYKAAIQSRIDKIARKKKLDTMLKNSFESGRNSIRQNQLLLMAKEEPFGLAQQLLVRQQTQLSPQVTPLHEGNVVQKVADYGRVVRMTGLGNRSKISNVM